MCPTPSVSAQGRLLEVYEVEVSSYIQREKKAFTQICLTNYFTLHLFSYSKKMYQEEEVYGK